MSDVLEMDLLSEEDLEEVTGGIAITASTGKYSIELDTTTWILIIKENATGQTITLTREKAKALLEKAGGSILLLKAYLANLSFSEIAAIVG